MGIDINAICDRYNLYKYKQQVFTKFSSDRKREARHPKQICFEKIHSERNVSFWVNQRRYLRRCQQEETRRVENLDIISHRVNKSDKEFVIVAKSRAHSGIAENELEKKNGIGINASKSNVSSERKKRKPSIVKLGSSNVRTLACPRNMRKKSMIVDIEFKIPFLVSECRIAGIDILFVQEIKLKGEGRIARDGYTLIYSGHAVTRREGVGILIKDCYLDDIWELKAVSPRIIWIALKRNDRMSIYLSVYAPTNNYQTDFKESFYGQIDDELGSLRSKFGRGVEIIVGGDFNARIDNKDELWSSVRGSFVNDIPNENGLMFLEFCMRNNLKITNTFFQKKDYGTWAHPRNKSWVTIDYILVSQNVFKLVLNCEVNKSFEIFSDHRAVQMVIRDTKKIVFNHKSKKIEKLDFNILANDRQLCDEIGKVVDQAIVNVDSFEKLFGVLNDISTKYIPKTTKLKCNKDWYEANKNLLDDLNRRIKILKQAGDIVHYKLLRAEFQRECRRAQSKHWEKIGRAMQELYVKNKSQQYFESIKAVYGNKRSDLNAGCLLNLDGSVSKTNLEIKQRWNEHFFNLLNQSGSADYENVLRYLPTQLSIYEDLAKEFSVVEVCLAINAMKNKKAVGIDQLPIEFFKWIESSKLLKLITRLFNKSLQLGYVDNIMKDVIISILFKKGSQMDCNNYRGLSLISHLGKVLERLIQNRLIRYVEETIRFFPESQNGFRSGRSTVDSIFCSRLISSYCREKNIICIKCFIDLTKAYDKVDRDVLWMVLQRIGVPNKLIELIKQIHVGAKGCVKVNGELGDAFLLSVGLKQGSIFAPLLFNIYFTAIIRAIESRLNNVGIKLRFRTNNNIFNVRGLQAKTKISYHYLLHLLYADDCAIMASSVGEMQIILDIFDEVSKIFGQLISIKKTEILDVSKYNNQTPDVDLKISNTTLKVVPNFKYVGSTENKIGTMADEIRIRIQRMAASFSKMSRRVFLNKNLSLRVKLIMFEVFVISVGLYGCAAWNTTSIDIHHLEVWHQRSIRKIFKIKWYHYISFFDLVQLASRCGYELVPIEGRIRESRLKYLGHVERMEDFRLPKILLHAECDMGQRDIGQPPINFRTCIKKDLTLFNIPISNWQVLASDRVLWRKVVYDGKLCFLKQWWSLWFEKYHARRKTKVVVEAGKSSHVINLDSLLQHILLKDKMIPFLNESGLAVVTNGVPIVRRVIEVNACLDNMFPSIIQKCQFDRLDLAISNGYISNTRAIERQRKKAHDIYEASGWP